MRVRLNPPAEDISAIVYILGSQQSLKALDGKPEDIRAMLEVKNHKNYYDYVHLQADRDNSKWDFDWSAAAMHSREYTDIDDAGTSFRATLKVRRQALMKIYEDDKPEIALVVLFDNGTIDPRRVNASQFKSKYIDEVSVRVGDGSVVVKIGDD